MKIARFDGQECRLVLTGMVTDQVVLAKIASLKRNGEPLFKQPWADMIARWCIDHMRKYDKPPNGHLKQIFTDWANTSPTDKETVTLMERFLEYLSKEYEKDSPRSSDYVLDVAGRLFNTNRLRHTIDEAEEEIRAGNVDAARDILTSSTKVDLGKGSTITLDKEFEPWRRAFDGENRGIVTYPTFAGEFFGDCFSRDSLYAFMGVDKSGKSFWLLDLAYRAIMQKRKVAYFEAGDMGEEDTITRLAQRVEGRPETERFVEYPVGFDEEEIPILEGRSYKGFSIQNAFKKLQKYTSGIGKLKLSCHANSSLSVDMIASQLKEWSREDWVPDVVAIDYADILAPPSGFRDPLDQIDAVWKHLRRLSQEYHCLVVTATQTNAAAYGGSTVLTRKHFSGRKTKLAHVNGMIGLNVSPDDKKNGVTRLNWIVKRRGKWSEYRQLYAAGNLEIGRPLIISKWHDATPAEPPATTP